MKIDIIDNRSKKRRIQIVLYDGLVNDEKNCLVIMFGGTSRASSFIHLDLKEFNDLYSFLVKLPRNSFLSVAEDRLTVSTKRCDTGKGDGTKIDYVIFTLYDVKKEWGYSQVTFAGAEFSCQLSQDKDGVEDNNVEMSDIVKKSRSSQTAQLKENKLLLHLSFDEKNNDEYYYFGHICIETLFLKMERDLLVDITEAQHLRQNVPLLFEKGVPVNFCPLGEMIDITFHINDDIIYADAEISDLDDCPTIDYVFHAVVDRGFLWSLAHS